MGAFWLKIASPIFHDIYTDSDSSCLSPLVYAKSESKITQMALAQYTPNLECSGQIMHQNSSA